MAYQTSPKQAKKSNLRQRGILNLLGGIAESGKGDFRIKVCTQGMPLMIGVHTVSHSKTQVDEKILEIISKSFDRGLCMSKCQNFCIHENEIFVSGTENFNE